MENGTPLSAEYILSPTGGLSAADADSWQEKFMYEHESIPHLPTKGHPIPLYTF